MPKAAFVPISQHIVTLPPTKLLEVGGGKEKPWNLKGGF